MKKTIQQEVDAMIAEMASLKDFDDDVFIVNFQKFLTLKHKEAFTPRPDPIFRKEMS